MISAERAHRRPIVGVMGSASHSHEDRARQVGAWLAAEGVHLLTGGGTGVMQEASRAFFEVKDRAGMVIGILPGSQDGRGTSQTADYPNPWVELPIYTHLPLTGARGTEPLSRNHLNVLTADVVIALPGSYGTSSEVVLALRYRRPLIAYLDHPGQIDGLASDVRVESGFARVQEFVRTVLAGDA